jgi:asparagine synthase (glutamine-hydrolysing)
MMYLDSVAYLPDDILTKVDRASMACSLETRVPLLDHRLVEFAWRLPLSMRIRGDTTKWALREVLHRYVPPEIVERPKRGFKAPVAAWLRGALRDWAECLLEPGRIEADGFLDPARIGAAWGAHLAGRSNLDGYLWNVLMFQAWRQRWL